MLSLKGWLVGILAVMIVMCWSAGAIWAEDAPPVVKEKPTVQAKPVKVSTMTALDGALDKLALTDEAVKTKVADALKAWKDKAAEARKQLEDKRKELMDKVKAETDKDKKKELQKQLTELKGPTDVEQYESAKATLKGILGEEQMGKLDELAKAATLELAVKVFNGSVESWGKKGVELTAEQKTKVEAELAKVKDEVGKLPAGARNQAQSIAMKAVWSVNKNVLTDEQREKVQPKPQPKPTETGEKPKEPVKVEIEVK